jgi:hypothetical protein
VEPIALAELFVVIVGMAVTSGNIGDAKAAVEKAVEVLFESFRPFVQGLDADFDKKDSITALVISREVQNVLDAYGGVAKDVLFGTEPREYIGKYELRRNEKIKLAGIVFEAAG